MTVLETVHRSNFDDNGKYLHCTAATHTLHVEPAFFDVCEYPHYLDTADDMLDALYPDLVNQI
jgi:hypothetical protein